MTRPDRERLEAICAKMAMTNEPQLPLFRDAADGRIALAWASAPTAEWALKRLRKVTDRPAVFVVGDDIWPERPSLGPDGWPMALKLRHWARAVIVHGSGAAPEHYREASRAAQYAGRCVMIETDSNHAIAWAQFMRCPRTLVIMPPPGTGMHPTQRHMGTVH